MEYTKGKWKVTQVGLDTLIQSFNGNGSLLSFKIANVSGDGNAHLIAAAPDMYETLKSLSLGDIDPVYRQIIVKALAKAEGKDV